MSRIDRVKDYAAMKGPDGAGRSQKALDYWADRAKANSQLAPRASDGPMKLPSTGKSMDLRDSSMVPKVPRAVNARLAATDDLNVAGDSPYMRGVRRNA